MVVQEINPLVSDKDDPNKPERKHRLKQRFEVVRKLGQGTYGKVQLAINKETRQEVAIKTIKKAKIENEQDLIRIRREIQIMSFIQHPHIIHIYEVFENHEKIVLIMQYASGGEVYDYLGVRRNLSESEARRIFRQIAAAVYYCHKNKICHRDLKLENILLDEKGNAKIADFGLSNVFSDHQKLRTFCGSPLYASPEIVKGMPYYGPEVDCWSLGVLLYTLVYGAMPFDGSNFKRLVRQISEGDYYEPKKKSEASGLIHRLLTVNSLIRATIVDICTDPWVNKGYENSLHQVAEDMANLSPVRLDLLVALAPLSSSAHRKDIASKNHEMGSFKTLNKSRPSHSSLYADMLVDNLVSDRTTVALDAASVDSGTSSMDGDAFSNSSRKSDNVMEVDESPVVDIPCDITTEICEVTKLMNDILKNVENAVEKQEASPLDPQTNEIISVTNDASKLNSIAPEDTLCQSNQSKSPADLKKPLKFLKQSSLETKSNNFLLQEQLDKNTPDKRLVELKSQNIEFRKKSKYQEDIPQSQNVSASKENKLSETSSSLKTLDITKSALPTDYENINDKSKINSSSQQSLKSSGQIQSQEVTKKVTNENERISKVSTKIQSTKVCTVTESNHNMVAPQSCFVVPIFDVTSNTPQHPMKRIPTNKESENRMVSQKEPSKTDLKPLKKKEGEQLIHKSSIEEKSADENSSSLQPENNENQTRNRVKGQLTSKPLEKQVSKRDPGSRNSSAIDKPSNKEYSSSESEKDSETFTLKQSKLTFNEIYSISNIDVESVTEESNSNLIKDISKGIKTQDESSEIKNRNISNTESTKLTDQLKNSAKQEQMLSKQDHMLSTQTELKSSSEENDLKISTENATENTEAFQTQDSTEKGRNVSIENLESETTPSVDKSSSKPSSDNIKEETSQIGEVSSKTTENEKSTEDEQSKQSNSKPKRRSISKIRQVSIEEMFAEPKKPSGPPKRPPGKIQIPRFFESPPPPVESPKISEKKIIIPTRSVSDTKKALEIKIEQEKTVIPPRRKSDARPVYRRQRTASLMPQTSVDESGNFETLTDDVDELKFSDNNFEGNKCELEQDDNQVNCLSCEKTTMAHDESHLDQEWKQDASSEEKSICCSLNKQDSLNVEDGISNVENNENNLSGDAYDKNSDFKNIEKKNKINKNCNKDCDINEKRDSLDSESGYWTPPEASLNRQNSLEEPSAENYISSPSSKENSRKNICKDSENSKTNMELLSDGHKLNKKSSSIGSNNKTLSSSLESDMNTLKQDSMKFNNNQYPENESDGKSVSTPNLNSSIEEQQSGPTPIARCCKKMTFTRDGAHNELRAMKERELVEKAIHSVQAKLESYIKALPNEISVLKQSDSQSSSGSNDISDDVFECAEPESVHSKMSSQDLLYHKQKASELRRRTGRINCSQKANDWHNTDWWYSHSTDKESSDNDDDLDMLFDDSHPVMYSSEDLWQFLKSINDDLSHRLKAIRSVSRPKYLRSVSHESKDSRYRTVTRNATRSLSREERLSSSGYTEPSTGKLSGCFPPQYMDEYWQSNDDLTSRRNEDFHRLEHHSDIHQGEYESSKLPSENSHSYETIKRASLYGTIRPNSFYLHDQDNTPDGVEWASSRPRKSFDEYYFPENIDVKPGMMNDTALGSKKTGSRKHYQKSYTSSLDERRLNNKPRSLSHYDRSISQTALSPKEERLSNKMHHSNSFQDWKDSSDYLDSYSSDDLQKYIPSNKASSEMDLHYDSDPLVKNKDQVTSLYRPKYQRFQDPSKYSISLGSKLNMGEYKDEDIWKANKGASTGNLEMKRKTYFNSGSASMNPDFTKRSTVRANRYRNPLEDEERLLTAQKQNDLPDETLLEALKTQGYKNVINQRFHPSLNECNSTQSKTSPLYEKGLFSLSEKPEMYLADNCNEELSPYIANQDGEYYDEFGFCDKSNQMENKLSESDKSDDPNAAIDRLAEKIKSLKNRCHRKSLDEGKLMRDLYDFKSNRASDREDFSGNSDSSKSEDKEESVSERIWRKSFFSRFNDSRPSRRKKSFYTDMALQNNRPNSMSLDSESVKEEPWLTGRKQTPKVNYSTNNMSTSLHQAPLCDSTINYPTFSRNPGYYWDGLEGSDTFPKRERRKSQPPMEYIDEDFNAYKARLASLPRIRSKTDSLKDELLSKYYPEQSDIKKDDSDVEKSYLEKPLLPEESLAHKLSQSTTNYKREYFDESSKAVSVDINSIPNSTEEIPPSSEESETATKSIHSIKEDSCNVPKE